LIFSGILSFGIIHGANDLLLLKKNLNNNKDSIISLMIPYLIMVILFGIFFYLIPSFALIFFVLFSSYHFGEQQWTMFSKQKQNNLGIFYFIYGLFLFSFLFWSNNIFVTEIIYDITAINLDLALYNYLLYFSLIGLTILVFLNFKYLLDQLFIQSFLMILLSIIFFNTNLIFAFGIYFVFWHSIPSIIEQSEYIYGSSNVKSFLNYIKSAIIYWIISLLGLLIIYYLLKDYQNLLISIFFSFLAAITFPHTIVIFKIKRK
tara:strand:- start:1785 stop:2567 length:783 start_codon:yes stop_codon:yes gene_type:complete